MDELYKKASTNKNNDNKVLICKIEELSKVNKDMKEHITNCNQIDNNYKNQVKELANQLVSEQDNGRRKIEELRKTFENEKAEDNKYFNTL